MTKLSPPGGWRSWLEFLPDHWRDNPEVVLVMVPTGTRATIEQMSDGSHLGVMVSPKGTRRCLQVMDPPLVGWVEHESVAERHGLEMAQPEYLGPLHDIPRRFLFSTDRYPILVLRDRLFDSPLNLKNHMRSLTAKENDGN